MTFLEPFFTNTLAGPLATFICAPFTVRLLPPSLLFNGLRFPLLSPTELFLITDSTLLV